MALGNSETWFWRFIGVCALAVCTLNIMVLMKADRSTLHPLENNRASFVQQVALKTVENQSTTINQANQANQAAAQKNEGNQPSLSVKNVQKPGAKQVMESVKKMPFLRVDDIKRFFNAHDIMLLGSKRQNKAYLVIGVPTVKRSKAYYLLDTLQGLVNGLSKAEQSEVIIVVFVADSDTDFRRRVKTDVTNRFPSEVENGLIQCIIAPQGYYPEMKNLPLLYGDSVPRVIWRSKQSLDYSFLYFHCADLGQYFLQLEDDVIAEDRYLPKIKGFINSRTSKWSTLEFGARGFIGMMYETKYLASLAKFCRVNFFYMPVDWLFRVFNEVWLYGNEKSNVYKPPIFKHIGTYSSLDGQVRKLEDIKGGAVLINSPRVHKDVSNPKATVDTSITEYVANYPVERAYSGGSFWGKKIVVGDHIRIIFETPVLLKRFVAISGSPTYPADALENSEVFVSAAPSGVCDTYRSILKAVDKAVVDTGVVNVDHPVKCIKLVIDTVRKDDHGRSRWLVISELDVWTK